jgi:hemerythrin-like domain-containing protein
MATISTPLTEDHHRCDDLFVRMEQAILQQDWEGAQKLVLAFERSIKHHFIVEEEYLFPALERANAQAVGPVRVMTMEHDQMRQLIWQLLSAIKQQAKDETLGITETLLIAMQQHNLKEENILYPMADGLVSGLGEEIAQRLRGQP